MPIDHLHSDVCLLPWQVPTHSFSVVYEGVTLIVAEANVNQILHPIFPPLFPALPCKDVGGIGNVTFGIWVPTHLNMQLKIIEQHLRICFQNFLASALTSRRSLSSSLKASLGSREDLESGRFFLACGTKKCVSLITPVRLVGTFNFFQFGLVDQNEYNIMNQYYSGTLYFPIQT